MGDTWYQLGQSIYGQTALDYFGRTSISADGLTIAVGATDQDGVNGQDSGRVRIFTFDGTTWNQLGNNIDGEASFDYSGFYVRLSGDGRTVVIGAPTNDGTATNAGQVRVFAWNGTAWVQKGADLDGQGAESRLGQVTAINYDGTIVAGSSYTANSNTGYVRVWVWNGSAWVQRGATFTAQASGDLFGRSLSLNKDGTILAIGASTHDGPSGADSGDVRVWKWDGSAWVQLGSDINGETGGERSGRSVSLSADGTIVAIGANGNAQAGTSTGQVRVWKYNGTSWIQRGQDINGTVLLEQSGITVSLSADGSILAIGSPLFANAQGRVRIFAYNGISWVERGQPIIGVAEGDFTSLIELELSADGSTVVVGATDHDGPAGTDSGLVRVFRNNSLIPLGPYDTSFFQVSKRYRTPSDKTGLLFDRNGQNPWNIAANSVLRDMGKVVLVNNSLLKKLQLIPIYGDASSLPEEYRTGYMYLDNVPEGQNIQLLF
jgi:hypothetical protein